MSNTRVDVAPLITEQEFPPLQHFINGAFVESSGKEFSEVVNPSNGQVIARVPRGSTADVAVNAAHDAFQQWGNVTPKERSEAMLAIANVVEENADLLARLEAHNAAKPLEVACDDVDGTVDIFRFSGVLRVLSLKLVLVTTLRTTPHLFFVSHWVSSALSCCGTTRCSWAPGRLLPSLPLATLWFLSRLSRLPYRC